MASLHLLGWQVTRARADAHFLGDGLRFEPFERGFGDANVGSYNLCLPKSIAPGLAIFTVGCQISRVVLDGHIDLSRHVMGRGRTLWLCPHGMPGGKYIAVHVEPAGLGPPCGAEEGSALPQSAGDAGAVREPPAPERGAVPEGHEGGK